MFVATSNGSKESEPSTSNYTSMEWSQPCRHIEFSEILSATENFDESLVIGCGGFSKVYKGCIKNIGSSLVVAAIKRLDSMSNQGAAEFWAEVEMLSKLRHCHLVSLIGYCNHEKEFILVYEYMPNGTLDDHLHKQGIGTTLSWCRRLRICIGTGRGLHYLHTGTGIEFGVIHRDVKSSNILLHESWAAKISDFGFSKIIPTNQPSTYVNTRVIGTFGYFDPSYFYTGRLTRKSDVYAFGVVLFEVLCRKRAVDTNLEFGLATWAQDSIKEGNLKHIIDSEIRDQTSPKCLKEFVRIAERCLDDHPKNRPTMGEIVVGLESVLTLQEKTDISLQTPGRTILTRVVDMFHFPSNGGSLHVSKRKKEGIQLPPFWRSKNKEEHIQPVLLSSKMKEEDEHIQPVLSSSKMKEEDIQPPLFKFLEIVTATDGFSTNNMLGRGGVLYKGVLKDGKTNIVVKLLSKTSNQGIYEFTNELIFIPRLRHKNIVKLLGYSINGDRDETLLIYEYMPNKSLASFIFDDRQKMLIDWTNRFNIIKGIAQGLLYLHHDLQLRIIHRDVKASKILLDVDMNPKISDFGLAKILEGNETQENTSIIAGTYGCTSREYLKYGLLNKSDVFSFGILMLEIVSGKRNNRSVHYDDNNLIRYAWSIYNEGRSEELIDASFAESCHKPEVLRSIEVGMLCVQEIAEDRPDMRYVVKMLNAEDVLPQPKQPTFFVGGDSHSLIRFKR